LAFGENRHRRQAVVSGKTSAWKIFCDFDYKFLQFFNTNFGNIGFFRRKLVKIAENCDHNIDPSSEKSCKFISCASKCQPYRVHDFSSSQIESIFIKNWSQHW
jgi:hypothetical protein